MAYTPCSSRRSSILGWLKNVDDKIPLSNALSRKSWKVCHSTWAQDGSCCDDTCLQNSNHAIEALAKGQDSKFREVLYNSIKKYASTCRKCLNSAAVKNSISTNAKETNNKCLYGLSVESAIKTIEYSHRLPRELYSYHKHKEQCFKAEAEARSSGICGGCSANLRENLLYGWGSRIEIPQNVCQDLVENCYGTWRFMLDTSLMRYFSDMTDTTGQIDDSAIDFFTGAPLKNLKDAFEACPTNSGSTSTECHSHYRKLMCDSYLNRVFPSDQEKNDDKHDDSRYKNPKVCKCKWKKRCQMFEICSCRKCYKFKKCHWKCESDEDPDPEEPPVPGTGNTDQGTTCGCPLCDDFQLDENTGDLYVRTVQSENLNCTTMDMYGDSFISVIYTFTTPYANNQRLNDQQTVTCVIEGTDDPNDAWLTSVTYRALAAADPDVNINSTSYNVNLVTCESAGTIIRDTDLGNGTYQRENITFYYNPDTTPFTTPENFPTETTTITIIPAYGF